MTDLSSVRGRFPALARTLGGRPCVFADAPGGTQVPEIVIAAMDRYLRRSNANAGGAFATSHETDRVIAGAREAAADLLGCRPDEIVFGPNTTTLAFALSRSLAREVASGDEVVVTVLDHDANVTPWLEVAEDTGATARWVDIRDEECALDLEGLEDALGERTRLVAFTLASNAVGTIPDAAAIVALIRDLAKDALIAVDAVHLAPHRPIDVRSLGADVLFCSAYKFFGPHLGLMYARREHLEAWHAYKVRPAPEEAPERWETGTQSHEALAGLTAAVEYLAGLGREFGDARGAGRRRAVRAGLEAAGRHEVALSRRFLAGLARIPSARLYGIRDPARVAERTPTFAIRLADRSPRSVAEELGRRGIFAWDGNYYALALMERLGLEGSGGAVRIGFCHYNTAEEVDRVLEEVASLADAS